MRRDQLPPNKTATYVMPAYKAVYVSVPKAACTSLKWLRPRAQGGEPPRPPPPPRRRPGRGPRALPPLAQPRGGALAVHPPPREVAAHADAPRAERRAARGDR